MPAIYMDLKFPLVCLSHKQNFYLLSSLWSLIVTSSSLLWQFLTVRSNSLCFLCHFFSLFPGSLGFSCECLWFFHVCFFSVIFCTLLISYTVNSFEETEHTWTHYCQISGFQHSHADCLNITYATACVCLCKS